MPFSSALSTLFSASFVTSEPLWLAVWGTSLIAMSMVSRSIGHRLDARRHL